MTANLAMIRHARQIVAVLWVVTGWFGLAEAGDAEDPARIRRAVTYLDARQDDWHGFSKAQRGEGVEKTACVSCHSGVGYALARPKLRAFAETPGQGTAERRLVTTAKLRVEHWAELDSPRFELMYDHDDRKKVESRGTEAVLNALILALDDSSSGRGEPSEATRSALRHLWTTQTLEGADAGSWDWLNFGLGPWEMNGSRAFGALLAAIAVGSAPGNRDQKDEASANGVRSLGDYLRRRFPDERLYNRIWILEASRSLGGLLTAEQKREVVDQILAVRCADGGWSLASMGDFKRVDGSPQAVESDGHATGLAVLTLQRAGMPSTRPEVAGGLDWLRSHQRADGSWRGFSVNKERDPSTFIGKLMSDFATAMAAMAIVEAGSR